MKAAEMAMAVKGMKGAKKIEANHTQSRSAAVEGRKGRDRDDEWAEADVWSGNAAARER
jgi:hypothetical protein